MTLPGESDNTPQKRDADMTTGVMRVPAQNEPDTTTGGAEPAVSSDGLSPGTALLVVKRGPAAGNRYLLGGGEGTVSAGRHPDSQIFLDDITVSRRHAEFFRDGGSWSVRDLGSLNGTYLNRGPVDSAALSSGDEVQIGKFRLVFLTGGQE